MRNLSVLLFVCSSYLHANGFSQGITLSVKNGTLHQVFQEIEKQTGYAFLYYKQQIGAARPVSLNVVNESLDRVLQLCFKDQPFQYKIVDKTVIVKPTTVNFSEKEVLQRDKRINISGKVISEQGEAIPGATVAIKDSELSTTTNDQGVFYLNEVEANAVLIVSNVSYQTQELQLNGKSNITVKLKVSVSNLDETVVVAYSTTTQRRNTGSVSVVQGKEIQSFPTRSIDRALQGMVPGLHITSGSGLPGGSVSNITLRGIATGGAGIARNPLYIVDGAIITQDNFNGGAKFTGIPNNSQPTNPLAQINPNDIESISILKDASAIALYGSQASNGVILITTKKGRAGKIKGNFRHQTDLSKPITDFRKVLNQDQYLELLFEAYKNSDPNLSDEDIMNDLVAKFPTQTLTGEHKFYPSSDWVDALYKKAATSFSNDFSFSGGTEKVTNYIGIGNLTQSGVLNNTRFNRSSIRYNLAINPVKWFSFGLNSSLTYSHQDYGGSGAPDYITSPNGFPYYVSPLLPIRNQIGEYILFYPYGAGAGNIPNPVARLEYDRSTADAYRSIGNMFAEVRFLKNFSFKTNVAADVLIAKDITKTDKRVDEFAAFTGGGSLYENNEIRSVIVSTNMFKYQNNFGGLHSLNVLASQEAQIYKSRFTRATGVGFTSGFSDDEISSAKQRNSFGYKSKATLLSYFAQANYDYRGKYFISAGARLDGSSKFGANVPLNKFWSIGGGWIISEENFLKGSGSWLNFLKIRGSVGLAGNTNAIPEDAKSAMVSGVSFSGGSPLYNSTVVMTHGNPEIKSESTFNTNLGLDIRLWNERASLTLDVYKRKTSDMVTTIPQAFTTGMGSVYANLGDIDNKGIELSFGFDIIRMKDLTINIRGNWSRNKNKLVKAYTEETFSNGLINKVGENFNSFYLVRWAGVNTTDGSAQWFDKDGKITSTYNSGDRVIVGKPQPNGFGGVTLNLGYKKFEFSTFFYYAYGYQVYNTWLENMLNDGTYQPYENQSVLALDRWQKPGDLASNPKRILNNPSWNNGQSTRYLAHGDYIRWKNILVAYNISNQFIGKLKLPNLKIFIQGNNLGIWARDKNIDPDNTGVLGENSSAYPQQKSFSFGCSLNF